MDVIKRNQIRINELAAGSPKLANQTLALDWKELQLALEECVFNQNLSTWNLNSKVKETFKKDCFLLLISLIQALTVLPFTSISHAPQLPVKQPVGISKPAFSALENQSSPSETYVSLLFGQIILIFDFFNLIMMRDLNTYQIHLRDC